MQNFLPPTDRTVYSVETVPVKRDSCWVFGINKILGWDKNKLHFKIRRASVAPRMTTIQRLSMEGTECNDSKTQPECSCCSCRIQRETNFSKVINFWQRYQHSGVRPYLNKIRRNAAYSSIYFTPPLETVIQYVTYTASRRR